MDSTIEALLTEVETHDAAVTALVVDHLALEAQAPRVGRNGYPRWFVALKGPIMQGRLALDDAASDLMARLLTALVAGLDIPLVPLERGAAPFNQTPEVSGLLWAITRLKAAKASVQQVKL